MQFQDLYDMKFRDVADMTREDLEDELSTFRALWTWLEDETRAWLCHIRYPVILVRRDYHKFRGLLGAPHFEIKSIDVDVIEKEFDYTKGLIRVEHKTVTIGVNQLIDYEFLHLEEEEPIEKGDALEEVEQLLDRV